VGEPVSSLDTHRNRVWYDESLDDESLDDEELLDDEAVSGKSSRFRSDQSIQDQTPTESLEHAEHIWYSMRTEREIERTKDEV
jgi:hypothetical protein